MEDELYASLFEIVTFFTRPSQDQRLLERAGVRLDSALFPLVMRVAHLGPQRIGQLADQVGRDYTTVSRQVDKLLAAGLLVRLEDEDARARRVALSPTGTDLARQVAEARRVMVREALSSWSIEEKDALRASLEHLAETVRQRSS